MIHTIQISELYGNFKFNPTNLFSNYIMLSFSQEFIKINLNTQRMKDEIRNFNIQCNGGIEYFFDVM
jgi:hypothetical protein